jgi:RNA polymerase sigma-70 factor, ECF subfamily
VLQRDPLSEVMGRDEAVRVLSKMSDEHRAVLVLRYLYDLPVDEVAEMLDRSRRATESLLVRARQRLAVLIGDTAQSEAS